MNMGVYSELESSTTPSSSYRMDRGVEARPMTAVSSAGYRSKRRNQVRRNVVVVVDDEIILLHGFNSRS